MDAGDETSSESSGIDSQEGDSNDEASQLADEFQSMTPTEAGEFNSITEMQTSFETAIHIQQPIKSNYDSSASTVRSCSPLFCFVVIRTRNGFPFATES